MKHLELLHICEASYTHRQRLRGFLLEKTWIGLSGIEVKIWVNPARKIAVVCFVGTNEGKDWISNLLLPFGSYRRQLASERNFLGEKIVEGDYGLVKYLKDNFDQNWQLYGTGHSKGGGEVIEAYATYSMPFAEVVTFAAPPTHNIIRLLISGKSDGANATQYCGYFDMVTWSVLWRWHVGKVARFYTGIMPVKRHLVKSYLKYFYKI